MFSLINWRTVIPLSSIRALGRFSSRNRSFYPYLQLNLTSRYFSSSFEFYDGNKESNNDTIINDVTNTNNQSVSLDDARSMISELTRDDLESFPSFSKPFVDFMWLDAKAGNGGKPVKGAKRSPSGHGPGYGGHGGDIILRADKNMEDLLHVPPKLNSKHGEDAHETHRGLHGKPFTLLVPPGTIIRRRVKMGKNEEGRTFHKAIFLHQLLKDGEEVLIAKGGQGGIAHSKFKLHDGRLPTHGERVKLELEVRSACDACLLGLPSVGKSSLISAMTRSHTRIGPEPFSTSRPHSSNIKFRDGVDIRVLDLPPLFEGACSELSRGKRVLRHTYRSKVLIYVIDVGNSISNPADRDEGFATTTTPMNGLSPIEQFKILRAEAQGAFGPDLFRLKTEMVIATKMDRLHQSTLFQADKFQFQLNALIYQEHKDEVTRRAENNLSLEEFDAPRLIPIVPVSSRFGLGIQRAVSTLRTLLYPDQLAHLASQRIKLPDASTSDSNGDVVSQRMLPNVKDVLRGVRFLTSGSHESDLVSSRLHSLPAMTYEHLPNGRLQLGLRTPPTSAFFHPSFKEGLRIPARSRIAPSFLSESDKKMSGVDEAFAKKQGLREERREERQEKLELKQTQKKLRESQQSRSGSRRQRSSLPTTSFEEKEESRVQEMIERAQVNNRKRLEGEDELRGGGSRETRQEETSSTPHRKNSKHGRRKRERKINTD